MPSLTDAARFLRELWRDPRRTGAVAPSSAALARAMAKAASVPDGLVIELGPGTGPVTAALLEGGLDPRRLISVEYDAHFCALLAKRFPAVRFIQGDAFKLSVTLAAFKGQRIAAVVSSLPLLNEPPPARAALLDEAFQLMGAGGVYVQFTYGPKPPIPAELAKARYSVRRQASVWLNLPPAHVWAYRRAEG